MWSRFGDGSELFVFANPVGFDTSGASVVARREIAGVTVERVEYASGPTLRDRFQCGDLEFESEGAVPPGYDDFDSFLARFIAELDCSQPP